MGETVKVFDREASNSINSSVDTAVGYPGGRHAGSQDWASCATHDGIELVIGRKTPWTSAIAAGAQQFVHAGGHTGGWWHR